jgi:hypothetical protein
MPWWVWVLVAVAVAVIGYLKLKVWNSMAKKKPNQSEKNED